MNKWILYIVLILLETICLVGDFLIKKATLNVDKSNIYIIFAMGIYASSAIGWYYIMKNVKFVTANVLHGLGSLVVGLILGLLVFNETLTFNEIVGIVFSVLAFYFLMK